MYKCKHFKIEELVPEDVFLELGEESCWQLFDENALMMIDGIREYFDMSITINNWHKSGALHNRGYRSPDSPIGSAKSAHKLGKAFDMTIKDIPAEVARRFILLHPDDEHFKHIMRMELDTSWLHCDVLPVEKRIFTFRP